jgi:hypothetical protein
MADTDDFALRRQLLIDVQDTFGSEAGRRVLDWWRRRASLRMYPGDPSVSHWCVARRQDLEAIERMLAMDVGDLVEEQQRRLRRADATTAEDDWLYPKETTNGEE